MFGHTRNHTLAQGGFTLIELSIVLVIIGLIAGAVVAGVELIRTAEIRNFLSQIDRYKLAVNAFDLKYQTLPGDLPAAKAAKFGLATRTGARGHGDGNGMIECSNYYGGGCLHVIAASGEVNLFWNDLGKSSFIERTFAGTDCDWGAADCAVTDPSTVMPVTKLTNTGMITVYGDLTTTGQHNINYFALYGLSSIAATGAFSSNLAAVTPIQAYGIDSKADDGNPLTGSIIAITPSGWAVAPTAAIPASPANGVCVSNASGNPYNTIRGSGDDRIACALRIEWES